MCCAYTSNSSERSRSNDTIHHQQHPLYLIRGRHLYRHGRLFRSNPLSLFLCPLVLICQVLGIVIRLICGHILLHSGHFRLLPLDLLDLGLAGRHAGLPCLNLLVHRKHQGVLFEVLLEVLLGELVGEAAPRRVVLLHNGDDLLGGDGGRGRSDQLGLGEEVHQLGDIERDVLLEGVRRVRLLGEVLEHGAERLVELVEAVLAQLEGLLLFGALALVLANERAQVLAEEHVELLRERGQLHTVCVLNVGRTDHSLEELALEHDTGGSVHVLGLDAELGGDVLLLVIATLVFLFKVRVGIFLVISVELID